MEERPVNHNKALPFRDLVTDLLQPLQDYTRRPGGRQAGARAPAELKRTAIAKFIARWRTEVGPNIFPAFRLIMSERDKDRAMYKIKELSLAKLFIKILGISATSEDAISLEKWKLPGPRGAAGDFTGRLFDVLQRRPAISDWGAMTIDEVNDGLDQLSETSKEVQQRPILTNFYEKMSPKELRWLACIILRNMKIGASERTFFDLWHPDAMKLFNKSSSLSRVCWELHDPSNRLPDSEKDISVFSCFQPQLAAFKKENLSDVVKRMGNKTFYIEEKLDGERIQLHRKDTEFKYWSRKAKDYTYLYGATYGDASNQEGGGLSKYLREAFDPKVKSVVLDGEMITWNDTFDAPVAFGSLKSAAKAELHNENTSFDAHPFYCVFDILHLNGKSLTAYSLRERRKVLQRIIRPIARRIEVVDVQEATKESEVEARLRICVAQSSEGLVVKDPDTSYRPNERNDNWIKVKPEYMSEFGENLDLLIIGGYWGQGRRGNKLAAFMCGLRIDDKDTDPESSLPRFISFCRVGGGFSGPDYAQIHHVTEGHWKTFDPKRPPKAHVYARNSTGVAMEAPDMWIEPEHSVVLQLKAASVAPSELYGARVTLRFPRFEKIRDCKDWETAMSVSEFIQMQHDASVTREEKVMKAHIRRQHRSGRKKKTITVLGAENTDMDIAEADSKEVPILFEGMFFYVMTGSTELEKSKAELEVKVRIHGGTVVQHEGPAHDPLAEKTELIGPRKRKRTETPEPGPVATSDLNRVIVIAERKIVKVAALISRNTHDMYKPAFIKRCISTRQILEIEPSIMFHMTKQTISKVSSQSLDQFGDSWVNDVDTTTLKRLIDDMQPPSSKTATFTIATSGGQDNLDESVKELRSELLELPLAEGEEISPLWMFARCVCHFEEPTKDMRELFAAAGGQLAADIHDSRATHFAVPGNITREKLQEVRSLLALRDLKKQPRLVTSDWIRQSWASRTLLDEQRYKPVKA